MNPPDWVVQQMAPASDVRRHLWAVVLGNGHGRSREMRRPPAVWRARAFRPPGPARLQETVARANRLIDPARLLVVLDRTSSSAYYDTEFADAQTIVQPAYRGTAPALFLPVLKIVQQDPHAIVVVLPGDQPVTYEARFMSYVAKAAGAVGLRPQLPLVIGAPPTSPDVTSSWIDPGVPIDGLEHLAVRAVRRFLPRPTTAEAAALWEGDGLVNTEVVVARGRTLLELGARYLPDVLDTLEPLEAVFGAPEESLLTEAVYEAMPYASIAHALFAHAHHFAVLPLADALPVHSSAGATARRSELLALAS
jgi:mannose-1-phosphate guanylyltransferase